MKTIQFLSLALLVVALVGCQPVLVQQPLGASVSEDLGLAFGGVWQTLDGRYVFYVKAKPHGLLDVAGIEWRNGRFIVRDSSCIITKLGDWSYLNVPVTPDSAGRTFFLFAPFVQSSDRDLITVFMPSYDFFEKAIEKKEVSGLSMGDKLHHIEIEETKQAFFETKSSAMILSSQTIVLKRTRKGRIDVAWPMDK